MFGNDGKGEIGILSTFIANCIISIIVEAHSGSYFYSFSKFGSKFDTFFLYI